MSRSRERVNIVLADRSAAATDKDTTNALGKSTLIDVLSGRAPHWSGSVKMFGTDISAMTAQQRRRAGLRVMTDEIENPNHRVDQSPNDGFIAFWHGQVVYENGRVKKFETERDAWEYLTRCDKAGKIIH